MIEGNMEKRTLPAGTVVHIEGVPVMVPVDTDFWTNKGNWEVIDDLSADEEGSD